MRWSHSLPGLVLTLSPGPSRCTPVLIPAPLHGLLWMAAGICSVTWTKDNVRQAVSYLPIAAVLTVLYSVFSYELTPLKYVNPVFGLTLGSPLIYVRPPPYHPISLSPYLAPSRSPPPYLPIPPLSVSAST